MPPKCNSPNNARASTFGTALYPLPNGTMVPLPLRWDLPHLCTDNHLLATYYDKHPLSVLTTLSPLTLSLLSPSYTAAPTSMVHILFLPPHLASALLAPLFQSSVICTAGKFHPPLSYFSPYQIPLDFPNPSSGMNFPIPSSNIYELGSFSLLESE